MVSVRTYDIYKIATTAWKNCARRRNVMNSGGGGKKNFEQKVRPDVLVFRILMTRVNTRPITYARTVTDT